MRRLALIGLLALISSACTIDIDLSVELTPSGSGSLSVTIVTDDEFERLFALTGQEFENLIATRGAELGLSFIVVPDDANRYFASGSEVSPDVLEGLLEGLAPGIGTVDITPTETALEFDARLNPLTTIDDVAPWLEGTDPAQFADDVSVTFASSLPGTIERSTATEAGPPGTLRWEIPFSDNDTRLFTRTVFEEEGATISWTLLVGLGTLVVAIGFLIAIRTRLVTGDAGPTPMRSMQAPTSTPPEEQGVGVDDRPPEDQSVAPPAEAAES